jgi:hypothetical protein
MEAQAFEDVFDALSDTPAEAAHMKARAELLSALVQHVKSWNLSQEGAAARLGAADNLARADEKMGQPINSTDTDLEAFRASGGKLLQYHGWNDAAIPAVSSVDYYNSVAAKMGGLVSIQSFHRLFMAPGMEHCGGGPGPNAVGGVFGSPSPSRDPTHDVVSALAHWVEDGAAPSQITATSYRDDDPSKGVAAQRPWCAYPANARFSGQGSHTEAASFTCTAK